MKVKKNVLIIAGAIIAIILVILLLRYINKPYYPDIISERPILGNQNAAVKIVEFSDFQCPACKSTSNYPQRIISEFGPAISVEFKHFPLSFHNYAFKAAEAAECANDQGRFWDYEEKLFRESPELSVGKLKSYAKDINLDTPKFNACLESGAKEKIVQEHMREGYQLDIPGTPTYIVNGKVVNSIKYEDIEAEISAILQT